MRSLLRDTVTAVWLGLVLATLVSWWLGTDHGPVDVTVATVAVLVVAFVKVRFVGMHFMELRNAPVPLRLIFDAWVVVVCGALVGLYLAL